MRLLRGNHGVELREAIQLARKSLKKGEHIASFPEIALERSRAPKPHTPGKPWEIYLDDTSPLWETHWVSDTCAIVGLREGTPWVLLAHHLPRIPDPFDGRHREEALTFSATEWERLLHETPVSQQMSYVDFEAFTTPPGARTRDDGMFCASEMRDNPFFQALFGEALEESLAEHRRLSCEYLGNHLSHNRRLDELTVPQIDLIQDPPLVSLELYKLISRHQLAPSEGARGQYLSAEGLRPQVVRTLPIMSRSRAYEVSTFTPNSSQVNLVIVND